MVPLGDEVQLEACFGLSDIALVLTQDRCTVCAERTIGLEITSDAPDGTGDDTQVQAHFGLF